jgi:prephenate dehydrogenase
MKRWKAIASIILIFLLGGMAGAFVMHSVDQQRIERMAKGDPHMMRDMILKRMKNELDLDQSQMEQVRVIIGETHNEIREARKQIRPQIDQILQRSEDRVRLILRPDQVVKFNKLVEERKKKREAREGK